MEIFFVPLQFRFSNKKKLKALKRKYLLEPFKEIIFQRYFLRLVSNDATVGGWDESKRQKTK